EPPVSHHCVVKISRRCHRIAVEILPRACLKNAFCQMCVTFCGRFVPNEGRIEGKGMKGNALCNLNLAQISRKVVNTTHTRRYTGGRNDFSNTL
ncbi:MAG: hypothetical protein K2K74_02625, partial [Lachnospiraceae bacterium]|nr:hypothetical protein [Lachnospiraceae bacterium]